MSDTRQGILRLQPSGRWAICRIGEVPFEIVSGDLFRVEVDGYLKTTRMEWVGNSSVRRVSIIRPTDITSRMASAQSLGSNRTRKPLPARALPMGRFLLYCRGMPRSLKRADYVCPVCNGRGRVPGRLPGRDRLCDECHGTGRITPIRREVLLKKMKERRRA